MMVHEWAGLRVSRRIAGAGRGVWRRGRLWVVVAVAVVAGACLVAGGSQQVYLVFWGGPRAGGFAAG